MINEILKAMKNGQKLVLVFDMDGTIADLYGVEDWLVMLRSYDATPYRQAKPLYDMEELRAILQMYQMLGAEVEITSWLSKESTAEYDSAVTEAKKNWLEKYQFPVDDIHIVPYGVEKSDCSKREGTFQILFDDTLSVCQNWANGIAINAKENNILAVLSSLLENFL